MKKVLLVILLCMILINISSFIYGKRTLKKLGKTEDNADENYKKGMRYVIFSVVLSFLTIIGITVVAILNALN